MVPSQPLRRSNSAPYRQISLIAPAWLFALACAFWAGVTGLNWVGALTTTQQAPPAASHDTEPHAAATRIRSAALFSHQSASSPIAERWDAEAADLPGATLHGIATGFHGGSAFALLSVGSSTAAYREGEEIEPGWHLRRILADRVELEADGRHATLLLLDPASLTPSRSTGPTMASEVPEPPSHDD